MVKPRWDCKVLRRCRSVAFGREVGTIDRQCAAPARTRAVLGRTPRLIGRALTVQRRGIGRPVGEDADMQPRRIAPGSAALPRRRFVGGALGLAASLLAAACAPATSLAPGRPTRVGAPTAPTSAAPESTAT